MLITIGNDRNPVIDRRLACTLAAIAGGVNTVAFHAVGFFSANMTGNVSAASDRLALGEWLVGAFYLAIVASFVLGAGLSAMLINLGKRRKIRGIYAWSIIVEAGLMMTLGYSVGWLPGHASGAVLVLGLSLLMGLQNAVVTRISDARVRTTHVSGMATDIGIELAMLLDVARGREPVSEAPLNWSRLQLHAQTIASFLAGGAVGVLLYEAVPGSVLFIASALLSIIGLDGLRRAKQVEIRVT